MVLKKSLVENHLDNICFFYLIEKIKIFSFFINMLISINIIKTIDNMFTLVILVDINRLLITK